MYLANRLATLWKRIYSKRRFCNWRDTKQIFSDDDHFFPAPERWTIELLEFDFFRYIHFSKWAFLGYQTFKYNKKINGLELRKVPSKVRSDWPVSTPIVCNSYSQSQLYVYRVTYIRAKLIGALYCLQCAYSFSFQNLRCRGLFLAPPGLGTLLARVVLSIHSQLSLFIAFIWYWYYNK